MIKTITIEEQGAQALEVLRERAMGHGISLERFLSILADLPGTPADSGTRSSHDLSAAEFRQWLHEISALMPSVPPLPEHFSRADIYNDHD